MKNKIKALSDLKYSMFLFVLYIQLACGITLNYNNKTKALRLEKDMLVEYYEAKLDYLELTHGIDFDETSEEFLVYLELEHKAVYDYFKELGK